MQENVLSSSIKNLSTNESENTLALKSFGLKQVKKPFFFLDKLNKLQLKLYTR